MTDTKTASDFEKACAAFVHGWAYEPARGAQEAWDDYDQAYKAEVRCGMLAALREMREPGMLVWAHGEATIETTAANPSELLALAARGDHLSTLIWQAMLDELIRQGERSEGEG